jgi:hypothetical protein
MRKDFIEEANPNGGETDEMSENILCEVVYEFKFSDVVVPQ